MEWRETRLRSVSRENESESGRVPADVAGALGMENEHRSEEGETDADRTDEKVFPHRLEAARIAAVGNQRR